MLFFVISIFFAKQHLVHLYSVNFSAEIHVYLSTINLMFEKYFATTVVIKNNATKFFFATVISYDAQN